MLLRGKILWDDLMAIAAALSNTLLHCEYGLFVTAFIILILFLRKWPRQPGNFQRVVLTWKTWNNSIHQQSTGVLCNFGALQWCDTERSTLQLKGQVRSRREIVFNSSLHTNNNIWSIWWWHKYGGCNCGRWSIRCMLAIHISIYSNSCAYVLCTEPDHTYSNPWSMFFSTLIVLPYYWVSSWFPWLRVNTS